MRHFAPIEQENFTAVARGIVSSLLLVRFSPFEPRRTAVSFARKSAVTPVRVGDLEYRASVSSQCPGCVEIWDVRRRLQVDTIVVYRNLYKFWLERDVQWKFINKLELRGNDLLVLNERGDSYQVNLATKRVAMRN
jgi:hypothetical protein